MKKKKEKEPRDSRYWFETILYKIPCDFLLAFLVVLAEGWLGNRSDKPGHPSGGLAVLFLLVAGLVTLGMVIHALRLRRKEKKLAAQDETSPEQPSD